MSQRDALTAVDSGIVEAVMGWGDAVNATERS